MGHHDVVCPYCDLPATLVSGDIIYPHRPDLRTKVFYQCEPCDAYVGCHEGTTRPLGRLADKELRKYKKDVHAAFDPIWQLHKENSRREAYQWLAEKLQINYRDCHVGMFDIETCKRAIVFCKERLGSKK